MEHQGFLGQFFVDLSSANLFFVYPLSVNQLSLNQSLVGLGPVNLHSGALYFDYVNFDHVSSGV